MHKPFFFFFRYWLADKWDKRLFNQERTAAAAKTVYKQFFKNRKEYFLGAYIGVIAYSFYTRERNEYIKKIIQNFLIIRS